MRKKSLSTALLALLTAGAYAQGGDGIAGITEATSMVTSYFYPLVQQRSHKRNNDRRSTEENPAFTRNPQQTPM